MTDETLAELKLALTEAVSNSVRHAYGGRDGHVDDRVRADRPGSSRIEVSRRRDGLRPGAARRHSRVRSLAEGGLGIAIIRTIADELEIESEPGARGSRSPLREAAAHRRRSGWPLRQRIAGQLLVVANRGAGLLRARSRRERTARRGGGGLVTALARPARSSRRHVDRERDDRGGSRGRGGARGARSRRRPRDGVALPPPPRRARSGGVRPLLQRRREPDALVPAALPLGARRTRPTSIRRCTTRGSTATCRSTRRSPTRRSPSSSASPTRPSSSTTTTSTSRRSSCATRAPGRAHVALRPHSLAGVRLLARAARASRRAIHEGLLANDVVGFHTDRWRRNFLDCCEDCSTRRSTSSAGRSRTTGARRS